MARKPKKAYRPPVSPAATTPPAVEAKNPAAATPMPEPRTKRVREAKVSAKEQALARKKAARAAWFERTA